MSETISVKWRDWYSAEALASIKAAGRLGDPYEADLEIHRLDQGEEVAIAIAKYITDDSWDWFENNGGNEKIVILEPARFAGTYQIYTDWDPSFTAEKEQP